MCIYVKRLINYLVDKILNAPLNDSFDTSLLRID
jgi:hypothetical protein